MSKSIVVDHRVTREAAQASPPDVIIGKKVYVKHGILKRLDVSSRYNLDIYAESSCGKCSNRPNRPNDLCSVCPAYMGRYKFFKDLRLDGTAVKYHALPLADIGHIREQIRSHPEYDKFDIQKIVVPKKMNFDLKFTGRLFEEGDIDSNGNPRANQRAVVEEWLKHKIGVIKAPPRTGKTVMATYLACELGAKTIVMSHQYKILKQFYDTYMGNNKPKNDPKYRAAMTNAPELEKIHGKGKVVFLVTNVGQLLKFGNRTEDWPDVLLINHQKFPHKMGRVQQFLNEHYSFKQIDELHQGAANAYAKVLFAMTQMYSLGLSATPQRKDELDKKTQFTVGPIVAESSTITIPPIIETKVVQASPDTNYKLWIYAALWTRNSPERNHEVVIEVFKDLAAGHDVIIVPVNSKKQQDTLIKDINDRIKRYRKHPDWKDFPYPLAIRLRSGSDQDGVIDRVDDGRPCVLVAIQQMIKQAIDMERPSMVYLLEPLSATKAVGAPMFQQLSFRVATPSKRKPMEPTVKIWIDQIGSFRGALTGLFWNELVPGSKKTATPNGPRYRLGPNTYAIMSALRSKPGKGFSKRTNNAPSGGKWV